MKEFFFYEIKDLAVKKNKLRCILNVYCIHNKYFTIFRKTIIILMFFTENCPNHKYASVSKIRSTAFLEK